MYSLAEVLQREQLLKADKNATPPV
jgi:hypothetical protein